MQTFLIIRFDASGSAVIATGLTRDDADRIAEQTHIKYPETTVLIDREQDGECVAVMQPNVKRAAAAA